MYPDLQDKTVMITGAAGSLGSAVVRYFHSAGSKLALIDQSADRFQRPFGEEIPEEWLLLGADLTKPDEVRQVVQRAVDHYGGIDVLINIAGGYAGGDKIYELSPETWDKIMNLNAKTAFLMNSVVSGVMVEQGRGGRIISIGAKPGNEGSAKHAVYSASKSAVLRLTESMAKELKAEGINVNAVMPSIIDTEANRKAMSKADFDKWVQPDSLAEVLGFLAADASRDVSGALIPVYGGVM